jgi:hypothetical protein
VILARAARSLRWPRDSSIILAMKMVHVTSEAKARPIITALTRMSADRNIDHGDNSRSATVVDFCDRLLSVGVVAASAAGAGRTADAGAGACAATAGGCDDIGACGAAGAASCCAKEGCANDSIASAKSTR